MRQNFRTQEEAEAKVKAETTKLLEKDHGLSTQLTSLTKMQLAAAEGAFRLLEAANLYDPRDPRTAENLPHAVEWFLQTQ